MKQEKIVPQHKCTIHKGSAETCRTCFLSQKGYCLDFVKVLSKITKELNCKPFPSVQDKIDIRNEFVLQVLKSSHSFQARNGAQFKTWANKIYFNTRSDFFRNINYCYPHMT